MCVPADAVGKTKAKIVAAAPVAEELPPKVDLRDLMAPDQASRDHSGFGGGCRKGCSVSSTSEAARWLAWPLLIAAAFWCRRRTR
jgi:MYXO-CTERM domain-containing protein